MQDARTDVYALVLEVRFDAVPVLEDVGPFVAFTGGFAFGVVVVLAEARGFVVEPAAVRVRVAVRRCSLLGACDFPPASKKVFAASNPCVFHMKAMEAISLSAGALTPSSKSSW